MDTLMESTGLSAAFWGNLGALIVLVCVVVAIICGQSEAASNPSPQPAKNWDLFKLGEIYDEARPVAVKHDTPKSNTYSAFLKTDKVKKQIDPADEKIKALKKELQIKQLEKKIASIDRVNERLNKKLEKHPLTDDCVDTLVSLGHRKSEAQKAVEVFLQQNNPSTVEEFLSIYYSKVS